MPDEKDGQDSSRDANGNPPPPPPLEPTIEQRVMALETKSNSQDKKGGADDLANAVKTGERWLIGINGFALAVSIGIGIIYIFQLSQMRKATKATAQAAYAACVSAQTAQNMFAQSQSSANDSHSLVVANIQEAAAELQSERASLLFLSRPPDPGELGPDFGIAVSVHNAGKGDAHDVAINYWAVLLRNGERLRFTEIPERRFSLGMVTLPAGDTYPAKAEPPHGQLFLIARVRDAHGNIVPAASKDALDLMSGGSTIAYIYGRMTYSDIAGRHAERFCHADWKMNTNTQRNGGGTENERVCAQYNRSDAAYSYKPLAQPQIPQNAAASNIACVKPKE